jgi:peptidyl-prolyl cis-trans isomerase D
MAFIGTLREKAGTWVVIFVFVAIASFILTDLFTGQGSFFNSYSNKIGEISGHSISSEEFQAAVREREDNYKAQFNREPTDREMPTLRQQAWELLIVKYAMQKEYTKVGVEVTTDEVWDLIQGKDANIDINVKQAFTDPNTGAFDRSRIVSYIQEIQTQPQTDDPRILNMWAAQKYQWDQFEASLKPGRQRIKYENLLIKTDYVTSAEAEREYHSQTDVAEIKYLFIPFHADTTSTVSNDDISNYYNKNKERFKTEESRDILYVTFPLNPSSADTLEAKQQAERIAAEFATAEDDSTFATTSSDGPNAYGKYNASSLPDFVNPADLQEGKLIGPFLDNGSYKVIKVSKISKDTVYSARARHILIPFQNQQNTTAEDKKATREKALGIMKEIKAGADFASLARQHSTDRGSAARGGDLGWFTEGQMQKDFNDAVFDASKTGVVNRLAETSYGYHIVEVTAPKTNTSFTLAVVELYITPGDVTTNETFRNAEEFAVGLSSVQEFRDRAKTQNIMAAEAKNLESDARIIGTLGEAREIVRWAFNDAEIGKVSTVFDLHDKYVVAVMTGSVDKGYKPMDAVRDDIRKLAIDDVRGKKIIERLGEAKGSLEEIAAAFGNDAVVQSNSDLKLSNSSLPGAGFDPLAIGVAFSLENGKRSKPFIGETGVLVIELQNKTVAPAVGDYSAYKDNLTQQQSQRSVMTIADAIKENSGIEDLRYKFY